MKLEIAILTALSRGGPVVGHKLLIGVSKELGEGVEKSVFERTLKWLENRGTIVAILSDGRLARHAPIVAACTMPEYMFYAKVRRPTFGLRQNYAVKLLPPPKRPPQVS